MRTDQKLWLDDVRLTPEPYGVDWRSEYWDFPDPEGEWVWVQTAEDAIAELETGEYEAVSLDHDLGGWYFTKDKDGNDGYTVACWIEEQARLGTLKRLQWVVHSANPAGVARMSAALRNADKYWDRHERGEEI